MTALRAVDTTDLNPMQAAFVEHFIRTNDPREAGRLAGYSHENSGYAVLSSSKVQAAIHRTRDRMIKTEGGNLGYSTLRELCGAQYSASVRLGAAKELVALAGHIPPKHGDADPHKPLSEMTEAELLAIAAAGELAEQTLATKAEPARVVAVDGGSAQPGHIAS